MNLTGILTEFKTEKNITRPVLQSILEDVLRNIIEKKYGKSDNFDIIINDKSGDVEIYKNKIVVPDCEVEDVESQISISDAKNIQDDLEIGEEVAEKINFNEFGYRSMLVAKQLLLQKIVEQEKIEMYKKYQKLIGSLITVTITKINKNDLLVIDANSNILQISKKELNPSDRYYVGNDLLVLVEKMEYIKNNPIVTLTRNTEEFVENLLHDEIPEVEDAIVVIKNIIREVGYRTIIIAESYDTRKDACGTIIGKGGCHIKNIQREIGYERIDIVEYSKNKEVQLKRCLKDFDIEDIKTIDNNIEIYVKQSDISSLLKNNYLDLLAELVEAKIEVYAI